MWMSGYCERNSAIKGGSTRSPNIMRECTLRMPLGAERISVMCRWTSSMFHSRPSSCWAYSWPDSVSTTWRVDRSSSLTWSVFSKSVMVRETAVAEMPKRRAVSEKLRVCDTDRNSSMARKRSIIPPFFAAQNGRLSLFRFKRG